MRLIAQEVGITPMAIYRHYANKQALTDALVLDALNEWSNYVATIPPVEPLDWLRNIAGAHLEFALSKPRRYEAAFLIHSTTARRYPDDFIAGRSPAGALQLKLISDLIDRRVVKASEPVEMLITFAALSQGLITLYRAGRIAGGKTAFRQLYMRMIEHCMSSFLRKPNK